VNATTICSLNDGFVIGFSGIPAIMIYHVISEEKLYYAGIYKIEISNTHKILHLSACPDDSFVMMTV